jgi:hypothetical protein
MVNAVPYQLLKRGEGKDIYLPCSTNPDGSVIYANVNPFPPVSNQSADYTVEGIMMDYDINPNKTEIIIVYANPDSYIIEKYTKLLEFCYSREAPFSIDVPDVPTPQFPGAYKIIVIIADKTDDPDDPDIHACVYSQYLG